LVYLLVLLILNSYAILFWKFYFLPFSIHVQANTILFPSILCTCPNQHNSISFHSLYMSKPTQFYFLQFSVNVQTNVIYIALLSLLTLYMVLVQLYHTSVFYLFMNNIHYSM
jgi:hypothetical protein